MCVNGWVGGGCMHVLVFYSVLCCTRLTVTDTGVTSLASGLVRFFLFF